MTLSYGKVFALLALCAGNSPVTGEFPSQRPVTRSFYVSLISVLNKRLSKLSGGWWFETQLRSLWRHCNGEHFISLLFSGPLSMENHHFCKELFFINWWQAIIQINDIPDHWRVSAQDWEFIQTKEYLISKYPTEYFVSIAMFILVYFHTYI